MGSLLGGTMKPVFLSTRTLTVLVVSGVGMIFRVTRCVNTFLMARHAVLRRNWIFSHIYHRFINGTHRQNVKVTSCKSYFPSIYVLNIVTYRPISRQRSKYAQETIERVLQEVFSMWSAPCPLLGNGPLNTFPRQRIPRQHSDYFRCYAARCKTPRETNVFSMWFAYIHCRATDVFSMDPPRDYISSPVVNQKSVVEWKREWSESSVVKCSAEDWMLL
jgi:hypothetical protein